MNTELRPLFALAPLLGNMAFFGGVASIGLMLTAALMFGITQFQKPLGKSVAITAGFLLVALIAFVLFVLFVSESARRGAPL